MPEFAAAQPQGLVKAPGPTPAQKLTEAQTAAMSAIARAAQEAADAARPGSDRGAEWQDGAGKAGPDGFVADKAPHGLVVRVFLYIVVGHIIAAFIFLLFTIGDA
ncbi:hypothetical protein GCM10010329_42500 [Streptomyces spiroverticillatus]|uniref:Small hydrophobic protein n=1 Tax=Streptomyces finlayi TaxID=67296 RepID=A0A918WZ66_9ACTN|nr:DUF6126 family protein [Streptomyces finlayi]GHA15018.1 hypothetical protein GCM10010329_42500 [Streptomyces spiroverticillatus]GHC96937.1 hypothetical protein GCM10010334_37740 [Streptomyces finlayi]